MRSMQEDCRTVEKEVCVRIQISIKPPKFTIVCEWREVLECTPSTPPPVKPTPPTPTPPTPTPPTPTAPTPTAPTPTPPTPPTSSPPPGPGGHDCKLYSYIRI